VKVDVQETGPWKRALHVMIPADEVQEAMREVVRDFRRKTELPGFRRGKVPEEILERRFGAYLEEQLVERIIPRAYENALKQSGLDPIAPASIKDLKYRKGEPLSFVAHLEVRPTLRVTYPENLKLLRRIFEVDESEVDQALDVLLDQEAEYRPVDRPAQHGDRVKLSLREIKDGSMAEPEETHAIVGSPNLLPEFHAAIDAATAGKIENVTISYPDDMESAELRGKTKTFRVEVVEVGEKSLPPADDKLAERLGFENLDALRVRIRLRLEAEEIARAERELEENLVTHLIDLNRFDPPETMVNNLLENLIRDIKIPEADQAAFRERQRPGGVRAVQRLVLLERIVEEQGLGVPDSDVEAAIRESLDDEAERDRAVAEARKSHLFERYRHRMEERRALDFLTEKAEIEDVQLKRPAPEPRAPARSEARGG
jgi:trigger factor